MITGRDYATACEIKAASALLRCKITIWLKGRQLNEDLQVYEEVYVPSTYFDETDSDNSIHLLLCGNHYQVLLIDEDTGTGARKKMIMDTPQGKQMRNTDDILTQPYEIDDENNTCVQGKQRRNTDDILTQPYEMDDQHTRTEQNEQYMDSQFDGASQQIIYTGSNTQTEETMKIESNLLGVHYEEPIPHESQKERKYRIERCRKRLRKARMNMFHFDSDNHMRIDNEEPVQNESLHECKKRRKRNAVRLNSAGKTGDKSGGKTRGKSGGKSGEKSGGKSGGTAGKSAATAGTEDTSSTAGTSTIGITEAMEAIKEFEKEQMSYQFNTCRVCNECRLQFKLSKDGCCTRCLKDKSAIKMFSKENNMDPGDVPQELQGLTIVEQQLICRIAPAISLHLLKHGGIAANGHCVTFPQEVSEPGRIFPKLPKEIKVVKVVKKGKDDSSKEFRVRRFIIENALKCLKNTNPAYKDIIISQARLECLPIDGQLDGIDTLEYDNDDGHIHDDGPALDQVDPGEVEGESSSSVLLPDPTVNIQQEVQNTVKEVISNATDVTVKRNIPTIPWPTRQSQPISEFTTNFFFTLAFPCLFPYAAGDFRINRPRTCESMSDWADHLLWYKDGRFAHHPIFKFIVHNIIIRKRTLEQSSYIVRQQLGEDHLSIDDLKNLVNNNDKSIAQKVLYFGASLRGSSQYWAQRCKELQSLIQYQIHQGKGLPSFFTTGSCAELHFKPLRRLLDMFNNMLNRKPIETTSDLFEAIQSNSHIIGHYFDLRTKSYFHHIMRHIFKVEVFWYRMEFAKMRGMIHWHGMGWRSDMEPHNLLYEAVMKNLPDDEIARELAQWARDCFGLTALHPAGSDPEGKPRKNLWPPPHGTAPPPPEDKNPLVKLLTDVANSQESLLEDHLLLTNRINIHKCSDYCLRNAKNGTRTCRMEFGKEGDGGKPLRSEPAIVSDKNGSLRLEMARDHPTMVQHSRIHTQAWRANGDISLFLSKSDPKNPSLQDIVATTKYVTGYACKGNEGTGAVADLFSDMVNASGENASVQGLCTKLLMNTVKRDISNSEAAYELAQLPLYRCSHKFQYVSLTGSRMLETKGKTATKNTALDQYIARDKDNTMSWYEFIVQSGKVPVIAGSTHATWPLNKEFCRTMLLLHWHNWRTVGDITNTENPDWIGKFTNFMTTDHCPVFVQADVERAKEKKTNHAEDEVEDDDDDGHEGNDRQQPEWFDILKPNAVYDDYTTDFEYDDGGPDYNWNEAAALYPSNAISFLDDLNETQPDTENDGLNLPNIDLLSLNKDQQFAFNMVMTKLQSYKKGIKTDNLRLCISGSAGSGKSHLINSLVYGIRTLFNKNGAVQVLCPTGNSANLISGVTLHSFLKIPCGIKATKDMSPPIGMCGEALQKNCSDLVCILVDERSMVGCCTLGWMEYHTRCGIPEHSEEEWGGIPVVVFLGDDIQLPPVCDSPVYLCKSKKPASLRGALVWQIFTRVVCLTKIIRQDESQKELRDVLQSMRSYSIMPNQAHWLQQFQWQNLNVTYGVKVNEEMDSHGLFVFPTHQEEWERNKSKLLQQNQYHPVAKVKAEMNGPHAASSSADKAGGLVRELYICKGAKVMLTCNLNVPLGLFNGTPGTIVDIIYPPNKFPQDGFPLAVIIDFPKYSGPAFMEENTHLVPIPVVERRLECGCCKRKQLPLRLGWGTTLHRSVH